MLSKANCHWSNVNEGMHLEDENEECPKVIEHFGEEVPEDADIRCQVGNSQQKPVRRLQEFPRVLDVIRYK